MKSLKQLLAASTVFLLVSGCANLGVSKEDACAAATTAYTIYLATINADGEPSKDQIAAAQAAAIVLQQQCGWVLPDTVSGVQAGPPGRSVAFRPNIDGNGVLILVPRK